MTKCIKCNKESSHSICEECADGLVSKMSPEDLVAHALVGRDALVGAPNLLRRLEKYKAVIKLGE